VVAARAERAPLPYRPYRHCRPLALEPDSRTPSAQRAGPGPPGAAQPAPPPGPGRWGFCWPCGLAATRFWSQVAWGLGLGACLPGRALPGAKKISYGGQNARRALLPLGVRPRSARPPRAPPPPSCLIFVGRGARHRPAWLPWGGLLHLPGSSLLLAFGDGLLFPGRMHGWGGGGGGGRPRRLKPQGGELAA
jgi:hypothetical protein